MGRRIQKLRKHVGNRVASTVKGIRTMSYKRAGFPAAPSSALRGSSQGMEEDPDPSYVQLHNKLIRASLAVPVSYAPTRFLKRTKEAVLIITGADLVLVKMSKSASASNTLPHATPAAAELKEAGFYEDAQATVADGGGQSAVGFAQATVLAQHELHKMIKCQVVGSCLELEFIMTGSAGFKVSAAALGFSNSGALQASKAAPPQGNLTESSQDIGETPRAAMTAGEPHQQTAQRDSTTLVPHTAILTTADTIPAAELSMGALSSSSSSSPDAAHSPCVANVSGAGQYSGLTHGSALADTAATAVEVPAATRFSAPDGLDSTSRSLSAPAGDLVRSSAHGANSSSSFVHWAARKHRSSSGGAVMHRRSTSTAGAVLNGIGRSASYVKSLGSSMSSVVPTWEEASRSVGSTMSSFKLVKTDEGDYWVCVESFTLQFRDVSTCKVAADLLLTGKANMRAAVDWLKLGLPFKPDTAVTHITEVSSSSAGIETLVSGPISWNTDLKLPASWARAISSAQLPQDQLLMTPLRVSDGPAAFRIYISTPAGLAVATLVPELLALLIRQPHPHPQGQLLAVPVDLTPVSQHAEQLQSNKQHDELQQMQQQLRQDESTGLNSRGQSSTGHHSFQSTPFVDADAKASSIDKLLRTYGLDTGTAAAAAAAGHAAQDGVAVNSMDTSRIMKMISMPSRSYASAKVAAKGLLKKVVTFRERPLAHTCGIDRDSSSSSSSSAPCPVGSRRDALHGDDAAVDRLPLHDSSSGASVLANKYSRRSKSQPAALDTFDAAAHGMAYHQFRETASDVDRGAESDGAVDGFASSKRRLFGSSDDLTAMQHKPATGFRQSTPFARQHHGQQQNRNTRGSGSSSCSGSSRMNSDSNQQQLSYNTNGQQEQHPSFVKEVYAVLQVQLLSGSHRIAVHGVSSAGSAVSPPAASMQEAAVAGTATDDDRQAPHAVVDVLGHVHGAACAQLVHKGWMLSAAGLLAIVLCVLALQFLHNAVGPLLVCCASLLNIACLAVSDSSAQLQRASRCMLQHWWLPSRPAHSFSKPADAGEPDPLAVQNDKGLDERILPGSSALNRETDGISGLRLRLLGAGFVREPLGMLQVQISTFGLMQERAAAAAAAALSDGAVDAAEAEILTDITPEEALAVASDGSLTPLVSSPEPAWLTPDWRCRILVARPTIEESRKLADSVHSWRRQYRADRFLKQRPPNFAWFQRQLQLKLLLVTPQGHVVLLLKMASLVQASRKLAAAGLTPSDMTAYCGFIWSFMFEVLAPGTYPSGRLIMVTDMKDVKLGQAVGEGQVGARAFGAVCSAWPERLARCLVLGTPSWFNMLYRLLRPHLSPSTGAKIQVCDGRGAAVELASCLGPGMVPKAYGGSCSLQLDEYPAQKQLLEFVAGLQP